MDQKEDELPTPTEKRERSEDTEQKEEPPAKLQKTEDVEEKSASQENDTLGKTAEPSTTEGTTDAVPSTGASNGNDGAPVAKVVNPEKEDTGKAESQESSTTPVSKLKESTEDKTPNTKDSAKPTTPPPVQPQATATPAPAPQSQPSLPPGLPPGLPTSTSAPLADAVVEERGQVSALYVGRVIGKGGEMIRDLQARSSCRIDVDQNVPAGQPRVITYRGTRQTVDFAKRLVEMLCQENAAESDLPLGSAKREFLVVPAQSVGKIIGRGGEMIRELQSRSQAKIQVDHSGHSGLDHAEKQVTITGTDQAVAKAKEMVLFLVANPLMDAMQSINMLVEDKVHRGGVWGSGPPYPNLPNQGHNMQPSGGGGGGYGYDQQPPYGGGESGAGYYPPAPAPSPYAAQPAPYAAAAPPAYQQQAAPSPYSQYGNSGGVEQEVFYAPKNYMGRIIGQKGVTINDLQRRSTCDIQINQDVPAGQDCEISIRGTRQGIEMVKQMLKEIIEIGPNHPYAGGQREPGGGYQQDAGYAQQAPQYGYQQQQNYNQPYGQGYDQGYGQAYQAPAPAYAQPQAPPYQQAPPPYGVPPAMPVTEWKTARSPDGQVYYYNERTGATQWEKPVGMP